MTAEKMFDEIFLLRQRLAVDNKLEVVHDGHLWTATFKWVPPATVESIAEIQKQLGRSLPKDYVDFLSYISNGAVLFYDPQYGQWGFKIYGAPEILEKQDMWESTLKGKWRPHLIAFAENFGDEYVMAFDLQRPTKDSVSCAVIQGGPYDPVDKWPVASRSFHKWLDHLVTAQGAKYWEWG